MACYLRGTHNRRQGVIEAWGVLIIVHSLPAEESHLSDCFPFCLSWKTKLHLVEKSTLPPNPIDENVILQIIIVWKGRSRIWPQESKCSEAGGYNPLVPEVGEGSGRWLPRQALKARIKK